MSNIFCSHRFYSFEMKFSKKKRLNYACLIFSDYLRRHRLRESLLLEGGNRSNVGGSYNSSSNRGGEDRARAFTERYVKNLF